MPNATLNAFIAFTLLCCTILGLALSFYAAATSAMVLASVCLTLSLVTFGVMLAVFWLAD